MSDQKKSKIPYIFFAFFAVIFAVDFFYIYLSNKTWRGVVTQNPYQKGLKYNEVLKASERQEQLGFVLEMKYQKLAEKRGEISLKIFDKNSRKITDAKVLLKFKRPTQEGFDFEKEAKFLSGEYSAEIDFPLKGQWDVEVLAQRNGDIFQQVKRYVVQ
jgi:nitrogen fixation protein FixH